jgi:hypothetical protein
MAKAVHVCYLKAHVPIYLTPSSEHFGETSSSVPVHLYLNQTFNITFAVNIECKCFPINSESLWSTLGALVDVLPKKTLFPLSGAEKGDLLKLPEGYRYFCYKAAFTSFTIDREADQPPTLTPRTVVGWASLCGGRGCSSRNMTGLRGSTG